MSSELINIQTVWQQFAPELAEAAPLPLWKPIPGKHGIRAHHRGLDDVKFSLLSMQEQARALMVSWVILAHRHAASGPITFGKMAHHTSSLDKATNTPLVWPQVVQVDSQDSVARVASRIQLESNDQLSVDEIVKLLGRPASWRLVDTILAVDERIPQPMLSQAILSLKAAIQHHQCSLLLCLAGEPGAPEAVWVFDQAIYSPAAIPRLAMQFETVLRSVVAMALESGQTTRVCDIAWVSPEDQAQLATLSTTPAGVRSSPTAVQGLFSQWVSKVPDSLALVSQSRSVTYREFASYVGSLAYMLQTQYNVTRGTLVAFIGERSVESAVAIMAIVQTGAAFVPIHNQFPADRIAYTLVDSACTVILTTENDAALVPTGYAGLVVTVDKFCTTIPVKQAQAVHVDIQSDDLAYIVYTSGTTGRPKGVMVEYGGLVNIITEPRQAKFYYPGARVLHFFNIAFDGHLHDHFGALWHGATLVLMGDDPLNDLKQVDSAVTTPSFWAKIKPEDCPNVKLVRVGGEPCPKALVNRWANCCELYNIYGPTETTIICLGMRLVRGQSLAIGKPYENTYSYVVDSDLHLVPMGVIGELLIGGVGVARGYCNLPELTAERFLPNPFGPGRVYRTGDLVRWLPDGNLEYIGRRDNQVKLNGFRIELEEVESVAGQCSQVQQAAVLVHHNHLVCFVTPALSDFAPLTNHLHQKLPHYMVPHTLVALAQLPTTVNGKIDKRALADLDLDSAAHCSLVTDSTILDLDTDTALDTASDNAFADHEAVLRQAWAELLDVPVERIARQAHFFQLGGDSIVAILLVSKCRQQGYQLTVPTVYAHPVLASLARQLLPLYATTANSAMCAQTPVTGAVPLTPIQQWFFGLPLQNPHHFNQSFLLKLNPRVDANAIQDALVTLLTHHDMLRCRYTQHDNQWHQAIPTAQATHDDYCWAECHTTEAKLSQHLAKLHTQLSLTQGPLLGALLVHLNDLPDQPRLYLVSHHIVIDLVSWRILIDDLNTVLSHQPLPPKTLSFVKWATSLDAHAATLTADCWPEQVSPTNATALIPVDQVGTRRSIFQTLDATITGQLVTHVCPALRVTPRDAILSAYALAYCQTLGTTQVNLCMEGHGREPWSSDLDISRTVGWFTSFYPLVIHAQTNASLAAVLHQAKEHLQQIPTKGFPYFLLKYMTSANADERSKLLAKTPAHLDVLFNYFGRFTQSTATDQSLVSIDWSDQYGEHDNPTEDWVPFGQYVMAMISGDTLRLGIDYNTRWCTDTSMTTLLATWATHLRDLVQAFAVDPTTISPAITRFDFDLLPLTSSDFDQLSTQLAQRNLSWRQVKDLYPCTPLQSGLLLSTLRNPHAYLVQYHVTLTGDLDVARLEASWQQVALHHSILRTVFLDAPSQVTTGYMQAVLTQSIVHFDANLAQPAAELSTKAYQRLHTDFSVDNPLFQVSVGALPNTTTNAHQMTITFHHAMLDGWSFPLLMAEVLKCYEGNQELELTTSTFKDVAQHILCDRLTDSPAQFWQAYLANAPPTPAPLIHPQLTSTAGFKGYRAPLAVPKPALQAFARAHGTTLSTLLRGAYALALSRYLRTSDVVFGVVVSGRNVPVDGIAAVIGPCLSTVPFRVKTCDQSVIAWLQQIHHDYIQMIPYEQSGNVDIARWCHQPSNVRLFNAVMGYENQPPLAMPNDSTLAVGGNTVEEYTEYPFSVAFEDQPEAVLCKVLWAQSMYKSGVGAGVVLHLSCILDQIMASSATTQLQSIRLHAPKAKANGNQSSLLTSPSAPLDATAGGLRHAIEACCSDLADVPVLVHAQQSYTWSTLATMAAMLGQRMRETMADSNRVAVAVVDSHLALVVSLLACIQCGASLVPISAKHPVGSINQLLDHLSPALVLIPAALDHCMKLYNTATQVNLDGCYDVPLDSAALQWPTELDHTPHSLAPAVQFIQSWDHTGVGLLQVSTAALLQAWTDQPYLAPKGTRVMHSFALDSEAALWTTIRALSQGCMLVDKNTAPTDDTLAMAYVTDSNATAPLLPCRPAHIICLVPLSMFGIGSISATSEQAVTLHLYATSVFARCATLTVDQYKQCVAMNTLPNFMPFSVVDTDGYACPVGVAGVVSSTVSGVTAVSASHGSYSANPWWSTDSRSLQQPMVYGYRMRDGATLLAGTSQPHGSVDGVQVYPGLIHPFLRQVGLCPVFTTITPASQLVALVDNAEFDLSSYEYALMQVLPGPLQPLAIMSTTVYPYLLSLRNEPQRLEAFVTAYRHVLQLQDTLKTEIEQWLAVHWIAQGHAKCDPSMALTSSFWEISSTLADLVALRHCIRAKFDITLPIHDMHSHSHFATLCTLIDTHCNAKGQSATSTLSMTPVDSSWPVMQELPVTATQLKVWCQTHDSHSTGEWYYQHAYHTNAAIQVSTLRNAFTWLIGAHDSLRTSFVEVNGQVRQRVYAKPMPSTKCPLVAIHQHDRIAEAEIVDVLDQHHASLQVFAWPLVSIVIHTTDTPVPSTHVSMQLHPLVGDYTAMDMLSRDLWLCYDHLANGLPLASLRSSAQYALSSYSSSDQPAMVDNTLQTDAQAYWQQLTMDVPMAINLPTGRFIRDRPTHRMQSVGYLLASSTQAQLVTVAAQANTKPFVLWLSLLSVYLARIARQDELLIGIKLPAVWAKHSLPDPWPTHHASLLLHSHSKSQGALPDALAATQQQLDASLPYAAGSLEHLVHALGLDCGLLFAPMPNVVAEFAMPSSECQSTLNKLLPSPAVTGRAFGPTLHLTIDLDDQLASITAYHSLDQLSPGMAHNLLANLDYFVSNVLADPNRLAAAPLTRPDEVTTLLQDYARGPLCGDAAGALAADAVGNVVRLVQTAADAYPTLPALEYGSHITTYRDLVDQATTVAASLQAHGVAVQSRVAVLVENHPSTIVMMVALWTLGAIYVPLDAKLPMARQTYMIETAECTTVVDATSTGIKWPEALPYSHLLSSSPSTPANHPIQCHPYAAVDLAYIIFTSGTTGQPKGVPIYHHGLMALVQQDQLHLCPGVGTRLLHTMGVGFDGYIYAAMLGLCHHSTLVFNTGDLVEVAKCVDSALLTPSMLNALDPHTHHNLQSITTGGEALSRPLANMWHGHCLFHNAYGPSEATAMSHSGCVHLGQAVTIGRPIANKTCYILDAHLNLVPLGVTGEIYIGGPAISPGYLHLPDLNKTRFITNPFDDGTLYATGDLGRWLSNGEVECLGRMDDQVKLRGMRLELQEVEAVLLQCPMVTKAAVLAFDNILYAFACPAEVEEHVAKAHLFSQLPAYMVPARIMSLDAIPLTVNGKVDKRALLETISQLKHQPNPRSVSPPRTPTQAIIREAMAVALSIDPETVGIYDSFFTLGGDSLSAIQFTGLCREKELAITIGQVFAIATVAGLAQVCHDEITASPSLEPALATTLPPSSFSLLGLTQDALDHVREDAAQQLSVAPTAIADMVPVSSLQSGFIVNTLKDPSAYMVQQSYCITGALDVARYRECWHQVSQRHSALRTKFVITDLIPGHTAVQVVLATMDMAWSYDESHVPIDADFEHSYFATDRQHGFAFDGSPLIRIALFKTTDTEHWLFLTFHHALLDAWSTNIVLDEVLALYHEQPLHPALQYNTYLAHVMCKPAQATQAFWQRMLNDVKPTPDLQLPSVRPPSPVPSVPSYGCHKQSLSCTLSDIHAFTQRLGITTNNLLRGLWALLLSRYLNEQTKVTFGVLASGRNEPLSGIDDMVGLSINTVPFHATCQHDQPLHDWLQGIHWLSGEIMAHEHASLVDIQKWAGVPADIPLFQSLLVYDKYRENAPSLSDQQIQCTAHDGVNFTEYPLTISFADVGSELHTVLMYATHKYNAAYISLICDYLNACLTWVVQSTPKTPVESMWQLPANECSAITSWSQGEERTLGPSCQLLPDLFLNSLSRTPDAIALESGDKHWTYAEVHQHALVIAQWLITHQVQPGDHVALVFKRSPYFVFAILAVLLVGGVYTPIETTVATERICNILKDLGRPVTLLQSYSEALTPVLLPVTSQLGYCDDIVTQNSSTLSPVLPPLRQPHNLAYIIFTSGTTGKPKGVQIRHESAASILIHLAQTMDLKSNCRFLQLLNIAFDGCLIELFSTFYAGGTVVLSTTDIPTDLHHVNACFLTPPLLSTLNPCDFSNVDKIISGGEALPWEVANKWHQHCPLYHAYGPTEITITNSIELFNPTLPVCISQPIPNTQCYMLDAQLYPVPVGVAGEICIAGIGVSSGYLNRPDLTAKGFVSNPFGPGQMYLTGDLGCWLPNGKIKYLGRKDHQVKLRGFRIELGEIESTAQALDAVTMCVAIVKDKQLVLYVVPIDADQARLREMLIAKLPAYMVPEHIIGLAQLPLTRIGKIDRHALQALPLPELPMDSAVDSSDYSPMFTVLREVLSEVLAIDTDRIQPTSSFFRLGGDSISAIQLVARCKRRGVVITVAQVLKHPILAQLEQHAELLSDMSVTEPAVTDDPVGSLPLTAIQRWFLYDTDHSNIDHFNLSFALKCHEPLTLEQLHSALLTPINHHDALRTRFTWHEETGEWQAHALPATNALHTHAHLEAATVSHGELDSKVLYLQTRLSVDRALNVAGGLLDVDGTQILFLAVHHLVVDLVSWRILLEDLETLLTGQSLPAKTLSFRQWAHQVNDHAQTLPSDQWPDYGPVDPLPCDHAIPCDHVPTYASSQTVECSIGLQATNQLFGDAAAVAHTQPQDFMLAALAMALQSVLGIASFEVDFESHGRYPWSAQQDISRTVGWFTSLYPVPFHLPIADNTSADHGFDILRHVKHRIHAMPNHGFPYGLREYCQVNNAATGAPAVLPAQSTQPRQQVMFNYVGRFDQLSQANAFWQEHPLSLPWSHDIGRQEPFNQAFLVTCSLEPGQGLTMSLMYSTDLHTPATAQRIADQWQASLQGLVAFTVQHAQPCLAPCDFELLTLTEPQFNQLVQLDLATLQLKPSDVEAIYPCLPLQEGMASALVHDSAAYTVQAVITVHGALDTTQFQQAWNSVVDRHPILRTRFLVQPHCQAATALQVVTRSLVPEWTLGTAQAEQAYLAADLARSFEAAGPLLRFALFSTNACEHHFILTVHHALIDGWSLSLLLADVLAHYTSAAVLPVHGRYQDVVQYSMAQDPSAAQAFWRTELQAITAPCHLPSPHSTAPDMAIKRFASEYFDSITLTQDNLEAISQFAQQHSITLSTLLRAVLAILLQYYTGNDHVLFGVTLSGRNLPVSHIEHVVGPCISTMPCHAHLTQDTTVWALLDQLQQASVQAMPYEHCSLADIHKCTAVDPGQALFNTLLVYENYPEVTPDIACPITLQYESIEQNTEYPLTILAGAITGQLGMDFTYRTDIFPRVYMQQVITHCERIVNSIVASTSDTLVSQVDVLSPADRHLLLTTFATNPHEHPVGYAHQYFLHQVRHRPSATALRTTAHKYTYHQLSIMAHTLAAQLCQAAPTASDRVVAIVADNSVALVAGQLAVWLAGCAFVVVDPQYPLERKRFILSDAQCIAVLGHTADLRGLPTTLPTIALDTLNASTDQPAAFAPVTPAPSSLAWLIYTSGSTGQPKGVITEHRAAANHFCGAHTALGIDKDTITPTVLTPTFDVSVSQIWTTLSYGGMVLITGRDFVHVFGQVDRVCCTPSLLSTLEPAKYRNLAHITLTGEPVPQTLVDQWAPHAKLINWYGPTEVAIGTHYAELSAGKKPAIGKPYPNASGYILNAQLQSVPIGVVGELYLGGDGVARGYLNQSELTTEKFIANPFGPGRLFKSGDLARWLPDGSVECLGRRDNQVKVRGYRIELDEVANTLAKYDGVQQACVMVQDGQLIGYVSPEDIDTPAVIAFAKTLLPHYMVPAAIVLLDALPLTPVGKIDRKALPKHTFALQTTDVNTLPRTPMEDCLIDLLAQVLHISPEIVSPRNTFFEVGGDSLRAIRLVTLCRRQGLHLGMVDISRSNTIAQLATLIEANETPMPTTDLHPTPSGPV